MRAVFSVFVGTAWLLAAVPAAPHHSFAAEFDINRPVKLTGTVTRFEWTNPHAWLTASRIEQVTAHSRRDPQA